MTRLATCIALCTLGCLLPTTSGLQMSASQKGNSRRSFVTKSVTGGLVAAASTVAASIATAPPVAMAAEEIKTADTGGVTVFKLKSGLQFIDLTEGTGVSPEYGQLVSIKYTAYMKLPNKKDKEKFDSDVFLLKHGNGRLIAGLDEGMHTMKVGGSRRIIIPPKLGFVDSGLGPVPQSPFSRLQLNKLLEEMIKVRGGNLIYDVEMVRVVSDEADQGYYDDSSLTEEQFNTLRDNIQGQARDSRGLPGLPTVAGDA